MLHGSCGEEVMTIRSAVLIQYKRETDGRPTYIYCVLQVTHVKRFHKDIKVILCETDGALSRRPLGCVIINLVKPVGMTQ